MKTKHLPLLFLSLTLLILSSCAQKESENDTGLWPPIEPYETGYLKVSDIHEIYYELSGNPDGIPVFVLHGGPGGGCPPLFRRFFDPQKYCIVLHDQRGANRSKPYAELRENNTWQLVDDIEEIRKHLGLEQMMLVGGSWGTTLALAYSEAYPERVTNMVLRGIWMATQAEIDHFYHGDVAKIFPDAYDELLNALPEPDRRPLPQYLFELLSSDDAAQRKKIADAWMKYEWTVSVIDADMEEVEEWIAKNNTYAFSLIENYYMANNCFLEENQLWNKLDKITHIPTIIINGRFDIPCLANTAYRLHKNLPNSELIFVETAGHGGADIVEAMANAIRKL